MKKIFISLFALLFVVNCMAETKKFTIYVNDQTGWGDNFWLYAWADDKSDTDLFGNWDGQKKTPDATEEIGGVTYKVYHMVNGVDEDNPGYNIIFSNNGSETDGQRQWFSPSQARDYYLNVTTSGVTQVVDESVTYHLYVNDQTDWGNNFWVYAWGDCEVLGSWADQKKGTSDGSVTIDAIEYKVYNFHPLKGKPVPEYTFIFSQEGSETVRTTFNITEARDYYLNVTTTGVSEVGETFYTIYIKNQTGWATPALFAYEGEANPLGGWPGTVSEETETIDEVVYIKYSLPKSAFPCKLIFNNGINGEGSAQLADYALATAGDYYLVAEWPAIRSKDIAPAEHHLYVRNLTSWEAFKLYAYGTYEAFGAWSTTTTPATTTIDGVEYLDYTFTTYDNTAHSFNLIFHQDDAEENRQLLDITEARDYYITVTNDAAWEGLSGVKRFRPYIPMEHVYGYQYDVNGTVGTEWPGAELYPDAEGWYEFIVNKGRTVIFNNGTGEGAMQTGDLAYTEADPVADECAVWQGETSSWEDKTYMTTLSDCNAAVALKYERNVTNGNYGTICLPYSAIKVEGAELFSIAGKDENGIYLDEASELLKGVPYIFLANADQLTVYYWGEQSFTPSADHLYTKNGLVGFIPENEDGEYTVEKNAHNYILHDNGLYFVDSAVKIVSNRAFIDWSNVPSSMTPSSAPRRRIGVYNMPTGVENLQTDKVQGTKVLEDGVLYLIYNGTKYNVQGQIVK